MLGLRLEIQIPERLAGFAEAASREGDSVPVVSREFTSSEDGDHFISRLEHLQECLFRHIPDCPPPSLIDHLLVVIRPNLTATVAINSLAKSAMVRAKRTVQGGSPVLRDDILDVIRLELDVPIPNDCAIVFVDSVGWQKSLFFDFMPILDSPTPRDYDLPQVLGFQYAYLLFQDLFKITDAQWQELFKQDWFPFRLLPVDIVQRMVKHAAEGWDIDELLVDPKFTQAVQELAISSSPFLQAPAFSEHRELIAHAFERFNAGDYKSTVAILVPRIEGILRALHVGRSRPSPRILVQGATAKVEKDRGDATLLMPARFREYLLTVYFREWRDGQTPSHVSRHTVSHGVAPQDGFDFKSAAISVLTVLQLGLYL
jgi:hypothetical protein